MGWGCALGDGNGLGWLLERTSVERASTHVCLGLDHFSGQLSTEDGPYQDL